MKAAPVYYVIDYHLELNTDAHIGNGTKDLIGNVHGLLLDEDGFPYIPDSEIRGLLRSAGQDLVSNTFLNTKTDVFDRNFGNRMSGCWSFTRAALSSSIINNLKSSMTEHSITTFQSHIQVKELANPRLFSYKKMGGDQTDLRNYHGRIYSVTPISFEDLAFMVACFYMDDRIGHRRTRGYGEVAWTIDSIRSYSPLKGSAAGRSWKSEDTFSVDNLINYLLGSEKETKSVQEPFHIPQDIDPIKTDKVLAKDKADHISSIGEGETNSDLKALRLIIMPLEDMHVGYGAQQGNIMPSLDYIPGRVVRGGLAGRALRNGYIDVNDTDFLKIFGQHKDNTFQISYPFSYYRGYAPSPLSLFEVKGVPRDPNYRWLHDDPYPVYDSSCLQTFINETDNQLMPLSFLCREDWPSDIDSLTLRPASGWIDSMGRLVGNVPKRIHLHASHDPETKIVGVEDSGLYAEECIPRAHRANPLNEQTSFDVWYDGYLVYENNEKLTGIFNKLTCEDNPISFHEDINWELLELVFNDPPPDRLVFMGRHRVPCMIIASNIETVTDDLNENLLVSRPESTDDKITVSFTTDTKISIQDLLGDLQQIYIKSANKIARKFIGEKWTSGWSTEQKNDSSIGLSPAMVAGSCMVLQMKPLSSDDISAIRKAQWIGIGEDTRNGYGRFVLNWSLHDITTQEAEND